MMSNANVSKQTRHYCCCKWRDECFTLHKEFNETDDPRGKDPIRLDLSGAAELKKQWKKAIVNNLCVDVNPINNWKQVVVMRHHWTEKQLEHFYGSEKKVYPSTPMKYSDLTKISHVVDKRCYVKRKGSDFMFNVPNYPMDLIRKDASKLRKNVNSEKRLENLETHQENVKINFANQRGFKFVQNVTFNEFWGIKNNVKDLERENQKLKLENEKLLIEKEN